MHSLRLTALSAAAPGASLSLAQAASCSHDIDRAVHDAMARARAANAAANYKACEKALTDVRRILTH